MPIAVAVMVGPGDLRVRKGAGLLTCVGLRAGACLCMYDPISRVGGMAYMTHSTPGLDYGVTRPGLYASHAVPALIEAMERTGAVRSRIVAAVTGGAESEDPEVETDVPRSIQIELLREGIHLLKSDLGGNEDRATIFDVASGLVRVKTASRGNQPMCELQGSPTLYAMRELARSA